MEGGQTVVCLSHLGHLGEDRLHGGVHGRQMDMAWGNVLSTAFVYVLSVCET